MKLLSRSLSFSASQKRETISKFKRISSKIGYSNKNHDTSRLKYECVHCIVKRCWRNHTKIRYRRHEKLALQLKSTLKWFVFSSQSIQLPCSTVILLFLDSAWHCWMCHRISDFFCVLNAFNTTVVLNWIDLELRFCELMCRFQCVGRWADEIWCIHICIKVLMMVSDANRDCHFATSIDLNRCCNYLYITITMAENDYDTCCFYPT